MPDQPATRDLIEPTEEEAANGWSAQSLTAYYAERAHAQFGVINFEEPYRLPARQGRANSQYRPLRWRG